MNIDLVMKELAKLFTQFKMPIVDLIEAQTKDPFKVLVSTILSARTNDKTTSEVSKRLYKKIKTVKDLEKLSVNEIQELIYPVGFYRQKAKYLKKLPAILEKKFNGKIPEDIDQLTELPGVGRKTANLVRVIAFKKPAMCVDVHVHRITNRWGYVKTKTPYETEMALRKKLPEKYWMEFNSFVVAFGQNLCRPINPRCDKCPIYSECEKIGVKTKYNK